MYDNDMKSGASISVQLRERREALHLSLVQVALRAGTSAASLSRYEHNWTRFEVHTLRKLADALECELEIRLRPKARRQPKTLTRHALIERLKRLFWDRPLGSEDLREHTVWVVERALEYGSIEDIDGLVQVMGRQPFLRAAADAHRLSPRTRAFWRKILELEGMACTTKYSRDTAWIS